MNHLGLYTQIIEYYNNCFLSDTKLLNLEIYETTTTRPIFISTSIECQYTMITTV